MRCIVKVDPRLRIESPQDLPVAPRVVYLSGSVEESTAAELRRNLEEAESHAIAAGHDIIPLVIDTYGGDIYATFSIVDAMQACSLPIATIAEGKVMSAGAVIFSCGEDGHRYIAPTATVMIHEASHSLDGRNELIKAESAEVDRLNKLALQMMAENCGHDDKDYFIKLLHEKRYVDWYLTPKDCKKHKLANHVSIPTFQVDVDVSYSFG